MTDRPSRTERRVVLGDHKAFLRQPLQLGDNPRSIIAHVRHVARLLSGSSKSPCSEAIAHITTIQDRTVPSAAWKDVACKRGCSHCCTQFVMVSAPEAFFIAEQIRDRPKTIAALREANAKTQGMLQHDRILARIWCPFLENDIC